MQLQDYLKSGFLNTGFGMPSLVGPASIVNSLSNYFKKPTDPATRYDLQGADYYNNLLKSGSPQQKMIAQSWLSRQNRPKVVIPDNSGLFGGGNSGAGNMEGGAAPIGGGAASDDFAGMLGQFNSSFDVGNKSPYDIPQYTKDTLKGNLSEEEIYSMFDKLNNRRNDIFSGTVDPYGVGAESGRALSPDQLRTIEQGLGKSYDPALSDVKARLLAAQNGGSGGLTSNQIFDNETSLFNAFRGEPVVKNFNDTKNALQQILTLNPNSSNPAQHQMIITKYAKMLDPDSVVRESEFAITKKYSQSKLDQISKEIQHALAGTGVLSRDAIEAIQGATKEIYETYQKDYNNVKNQYQSLAQRRGLNPENIVIDYEGDYMDSGGNGDASNMPVYPGFKYNPSTGRYDKISFNSVGGDTNSAMNKIAKIESGGNYSALGPMVQSGQYRGQRALGKYQIMPGNLPAWSKEALGYQVTPQQFLSNPKIQDAVAQHRMNQIFKQYRNWNDVASVWFTGRPLARAGNARDVTGTTVQQYVRNFANA